MKKVMIPVVLACFLFCLAGCGEHGGTQIPPEPSGTAEQSHAPEQDDAPEPAWVPALLETAQLMTADGVLRYIPNSVIEENLMQEIALFQNGLLCSCFVYDAQTGTDLLQLRLLSLDTGELLREARLAVAGAYAVTVQVCGDRIAVCDAQDGTIHVLDGTLTQTASFQAGGDTVLVDSALTRAYCLTRMEGIRAIDLESGAEQVILEQAGDLTLCARSGDDISIRYIDLTSAGKMECYAGLDLAGGELEFFTPDESLSAPVYHGGVWAGTLLSGENTYFLGTAAQPRCFTLELSCPAVCLAGDPARLILTNTEPDGTQSAAAYETDGTFLSSFSTGDAGITLTDTRVWLEGAEGFLMIAIDETGHDRLCFWDMSRETQGDDLILTPCGGEDGPEDGVLDTRYYERARELSALCGAQVKIADRCRTQYGEKLVELECDPELVEAGLDALEEALSHYPDGFFEQLRYGSCRTVEIHLVGEIRDSEPIEGFSPTAFVQQQDGRILMVLNIDMVSAVLVQNFYHESSHIIDKVLAHNALYREGALYSEEGWQALNPAQFVALNPATGGYYDSYEMMPMEYYQESFSGCFAADYGKSFATEDRATIFEYAMQGNSWMFSPQTAPTLYAKLEYYCQCIRDCFDTEGWPQYTAWEAPLRDAAE